MYQKKFHTRLSLSNAMTNQMYIARKPKYGGMQWQRFCSDNNSGRECIFVLRDFAKGDTVLLASVSADELETEVPEKSAPNMQMKECGKAHLGSPALMGY